METSADPFAREHFVVLIHGIRTQANWAEMVASVLERETGVKVVPLKYGFFDVFRFLCPFFTRRGPVERVVRELRDLRTSHPTARISAVAHSFGTYALTKALEEPDIRLDRVILCGCIVPEAFRRARHEAQLGADSILNDCGTHDIWPVLAKSITWGYGATGTFGFGTVGIRDRFNKFGHSDYFDENFVRRYWVPFITKGEVRQTDWERGRSSPPYWQSLLAWFPIRWLLVVLAMGLPLMAWLKPFSPSPKPVVTFGPKALVGHYTGAPVLVTHLAFANPTRHQVTFAGFQLALVGPDQQRIPMAVEAIVIGSSTMQPLPAVVAEPRQTVGFDYSFFNYDSGHTALRQEVEEALTKSGFVLGNPDPEKRIITEHLEQKACKRVAENFIWTPGNWTLEFNYVNGSLSSKAQGHFYLSPDEVKNMLAITNYYRSGIGVLAVWRFLKQGNAEPVRTVDLQVDVK